MIASDAYEKHDRITATRDQEGSYAMVYSERGKPFAVDLSRLKGKKFAESWYDVRSGRSHRIGDYQQSEKQWFHPPTTRIGKDWVPVLDDINAGFPPPGKGDAIR